MSIRARQDLRAAPLRMHPAFEEEFPDCERSASEAVLNLTFTGTLAINRVDDVLAPFGLVLKSFSVLAVLHGSDEALTPTVIAQRTLVAKTSVTSALDSLERLGYVLRSQHPSSRRSTLVTLTPKGRAAAEAALHTLHRAEAEWMASLPPSRRESLVRLLGATTRALIGAGKEERHARGQ